MSKIYRECLAINLPCMPNKHDEVILKPVDSGFIKTQIYAYYKKQIFDYKKVVEIFETQKK